MKRLTTILLSVFSVLLLSAQTQHGYVKTKGRLGADGNVIPGVRLSGATVSIKDRSALISASDGAFSFPLPGKDYIVENVRKNGYLLTDAEQLRSYGYSSNPLILVMETPEQQNEDRLMAERKINRTLRRTLQQREDELDSLRAANRITKEEYHKLNAQLYDDEERNRKLIDEMVERYAKMDFDQMDERNREIKACILNGELLKADSLINSKGSLDARIMEYNRLREANAREAEELKKRSEILASSRTIEEKTLLELAEDCFNKSEVFKMCHQNDSAAYYLTIRAELDTTNVQWQLEAGRFLDEYLAAYNKALDYYNRALRNALMEYGKIHSDVAICYNNVGFIYHIQGDYSNALKYYNEALDIWLYINGVNHPYIAKSYNNIGGVYNSQGDYEKAMEYYNKALKIYISVYGEQYSKVALCYNNIGLAYDSLGDPIKAMEYLKKALDIYLKVYGEQNPHVSAVYISIGSIYSSQGKFTEALQYTYKALEILQTFYDEQHPHVALCYNNMGYIYSSQGDYLKAMKYYQKALEIQLAIYGDNHPNVGTCYSYIYNLYYTCGDYVKSLEYLDKYIKFQLSVYGEQHPDVANSYILKGMICYTMKDCLKAVEYYNKALNIQLSVFGKNNPDVTMNYKIMGVAYDELGDYYRALEYYQKALVICRNLYGYNDKETIVCSKLIYMVYCNLLQQSNEYKYDFQKFLSEYSYIISIVEGENPATKQGMYGQYYLLEFDDWNIYSLKSIFEKNTEMQGKPKDLLVLKDNDITKYHFENKIGCQIELKYVGKEEKQRIVKSYKKWKKE